MTGVITQTNRSLNIGGIHKFSMIEYPGKLCAVFFTQGCNFRCPYCHNPELVKPELFGDIIEDQEVLSFLESRRGKLEAVSITGGEPTLHSGLINFLKDIKAIGYHIKLDTNGSNPQVLGEAIDLKLVDYLAMDIKAPLAKYEEVARVRVDTEKIKESINLIINSGIKHEFRTTIAKTLLAKEDIYEIAKLIKGAKQYALQRLSNLKTLDKQFLKKTAYSFEELVLIKKEVEKYLDCCLIRN